MKRAGLGERPSDSLCSDHTHREGGKRADAGSVDAQQAAMASGGAAAVFSRPAAVVTEPASVSGSKPEAEAADRREAWLDRGQFPSFEFASIEDAEVLEAEAVLRGVARPAATPPRFQDEQARRLTGVAADMQKLIQSDVALIMKELAMLPAPGSTASSTVSGAKTAFSLFVKHLQDAKLAAAAGDQDRMTAELTLALGRLQHFTDSHAAPGASKPLAFNASQPKVRSTLASLASACRHWGGAEAATETSSSSTDAHDSTGLLASETRARSVSSPERPAVVPTPGDSRSPDSSRPASPGRKPSDRKNEKDREKARSPNNTAGRKLKALFTRSSEGRNSKKPEADAGNDPRSPRSRAGSASEPAGPAADRPAADAVASPTRSRASSGLASPVRREKHTDTDTNT